MRAEKGGLDLTPHPRILRNVNLRGPMQFRICEHWSFFCSCVHLYSLGVCKWFLKHFSWCFTLFTFWKIHRVCACPYKISGNLYILHQSFTDVHCVPSLHHAMNYEESTSVPKQPVQSSHAFPLPVRSVHHCAAQTSTPGRTALENRPASPGPAPPAHSS